MVLQSYRVSVLPWFLDPASRRKKSASRYDGWCEWRFIAVETGRGAGRCKAGQGGRCNAGQGGAGVARVQGCRGSRDRSGGQACREGRGRMARAGEGGIVKNIMIYCGYRNQRNVIREEVCKLSVTSVQSFYKHHDARTV